MRNHIPKVESLLKTKRKQDLVFDENAKNHPERIYVQQESAGGSAAPAGDVGVAGGDAAWPWLLVTEGSACPTPGGRGPRGAGRLPPEQKAIGAGPAGPG